jgi:hypothetical protein
MQVQLIFVHKALIVNSLDANLSGLSIAPSILMLLFSVMSQQLSSRVMVIQNLMIENAVLN